MFLYINDLIGDERDKRKFVLVCGDAAYQHKFPLIPYLVGEIIQSGF